MNFILKCRGIQLLKSNALPSKPFKIEPREKFKQVVVLYTDENLSKDSQKDTHIPLKIRAYALNSQEKIEVMRESVFIYPPSNVIKAK